MSADNIQSQLERTIAGDTIQHIFIPLSGELTLTRPLRIPSLQEATLASIDDAPAVLDGRHTSRLIIVEAGATLNLINIDLVNGLAPPGERGGALLLNASNGASAAKLTAQVCRFSHGNAEAGAAIYAIGTHGRRQIARTHPHAPARRIALAHVRAQAAWT